MKPRTNETKTNLIRMYEKMNEVLIEAAEHFFLQYQSEAYQYLHGAGHDDPDLVAFEVSFRKQKATCAAIQALSDMVEDKEREIAGSDDELLDLLRAAHEEEAEEDEAFLKDAKRKYGGARK